MNIKENYAGAILISWKLYNKFIKSISFNDFEKLITDNYNYVDAMTGVELFCDKCKKRKEVKE